MKKIGFVLLLITLGYFVSAQTGDAYSLSFLRTSGQDIINEKGEKVFLKGVGLGNWLLPEGYMWKFGAAGDRPRKIEKVVEELIGKEKAAEFWKSFRKNYITEADIKRIAELGFNSVRPALNSKLFLTEGDNPVFVDEGFILMDSLISWCNKHKLYVIIDMHGAPGGQTGANIDDSPKDLPELFMDMKNQDRLVDLWVRIATRYKDNPTVAAYDLLNEPLPVNTGSAEKYKHLLVPLYQRLIREIRKVDSKHMITLEGFDWSNDWSLFDKPLADNVFYQFHYYCWARPDQLNDISQFLRKREALNTPVWVGETGEKGNTIYWATTQYFEANNIGFSFWPWKKMDTQNTPYSIKKPLYWDVIAEYTRGGPKPDSKLAEETFNQFLENIKLDQCQYFEDVCNAILTRIPGKIQAENYGHQGYMISYFVKDTSFRSSFYRKNEPVNIVLDSEDEKVIWSEQSIILKDKEWVIYTFNNRKKGGYQVDLNAAVLSKDAVIDVTINGNNVAKKIEGGTLTKHPVGYFTLPAGTNKIQVRVRSGTLKLDYLDLN